MGDPLSLVGSHWFHGIVTDANGNAISGVTVTLISIDNPQGIGTTITTATGYYQINVQNYTNDGDLVNVVFANGSNTCGEGIRVDVRELTQKVDMQYNADRKFKITSDTWTICMPLPDWNNVSGQITQQNKLFNFRTGEISVVARGIGKEGVRLSGTIERNVNVDVTSGKVEAFDNIQNNEEPVTITGLATMVDATYIIKSFRLGTIPNTKEAYSWSLDLEYKEE